MGPLGHHPPISGLCGDKWNEPAFSDPCVLCQQIWRMLGLVGLRSSPELLACRPLNHTPDLCGFVFLQPHEALAALGALGDEVRLSVLLTALGGFRFKRCQEPGDSMVARATWSPALYPGHPHGVP